MRLNGDDRPELRELRRHEQETDPCEVPERYHDRGGGGATVPVAGYCGAAPFGIFKRSRSSAIFLCSAGLTSETGTFMSPTLISVGSNVA